MKTSVRIGAFEIDDGELHGESPGDRTRCKISPKLNGTAPHFGDEMFALVLFVCYLDGGCEDIVVDVYNTEQQCLYSMSDQRIRHGGCFPIEDFIDGFWRPAQEYGDF